MEHSQELRERLERITSPSLQNWQAPYGPHAEKMKENASVDMGWGRILFGQTFLSPKTLFTSILDEGESSRDIAFYIRDPHVLLSLGPDKLFLDPSHTYRLWLHGYRTGIDRYPAVRVRRVLNIDDAEAVNRIYAGRNMVTCPPNFMMNRHTSRTRTFLVAESVADNKIIGTVTGLDHVTAFNDPENGASLWCLAVDPQADSPGVGEALVRHLIEHYVTKGRSYIDLSVMHDNREAIRLYEKIGFQRVPVFCIKRKNKINEPIFSGPSVENRLNPYAQIITKEARRRGISVEVLDEENAYFVLSFGGRSITCRESLSELTSAIAMCRCDDKRLTHDVLEADGLNVPKQYPAGSFDYNMNVLEMLQRVVVKPARGEQGDGVSVDVRRPEDLKKAVRKAEEFCKDVVIEAYVPGEDLRIIVIDNQVVAAAVRRPPRITGTGEHTVEALIEKYNRRRASATGGESHVPMDDETKRCLRTAGYDIHSILPVGEKIDVRKTANLHTGGTIHDVTEQLHPDLSKAAVRAAQAINIPVTGLDLMVTDVSGPDYVIIEANERPGLANHEPQPTAERFIDLLFPQTAETC